MIVETLVVGMIQANCYVLGDEASGEAVVIDPGGDTPVVVRALAARKLKPVAIVATSCSSRRPRSTTARRPPARTCHDR